MDDTCAVCAETLEWVAYGPCGHQEVCSTCISRLRFICDDRRCCICKSESSIIFVTKALGDYTRTMNDFSVFPANPTEGRVGQYWYHEGTQAFFDDLDHYKMIKATCKLSCIVCDKMDEQRNEESKRRGNFRNIEQLKGHLFHSHKLFMCSLCLEGRKIFICEQNLYTREQLNQHINTGDSEVDGSENERGGFMGHPMCEFCRNPFYGDNELYTHMSTEHYTCHICQRQHPGQYEYFKNYDELEIHFRRDHILCEDEGCLAKKFIVFTSDSEMKRHNALEHGGQMSRSQRSVALQIPTSFRFERSVEQDRRRRGFSFRRDSSDNQLSLAIQASLETANLDSSRATSSGNSNYREADVTSVLRPLESLTTRDSNPSSGITNAPLEASSFPPLPKSTRKSRQKSKSDSAGLGKNTMAARLRQRNNVTVVHPSRAWPGQPTSTMSTSQSKATSSSNSSLKKPTSVIEFVQPGSSSKIITSLGRANHPTLTPNVVNRGSFDPSPFNFPPVSATQPSKLVTSVAQNSSSSLRKPTSVIEFVQPGRANHPTLTPNLVNRRSFDPSPSNFPPVSATQPSKLSTSVAWDRGSFDPSLSNFPPVSATQTSKGVTTRQPLSKVDDVHTANKSLVERIRAVLEFDEDKYAAFKVISAEYRQGVIETAEYLAYVYQFGLSHLITELARLCPDAQKQKELLEACNGQLKHKKSSKKGKEKVEDNGDSSFKAVLASAKESQPRYDRSAETVEVLSKDGYRSAKGKSKVLTVHEQEGLSYVDQNVSKKIEGGSKPQKKTSKFLRVRLGDSSPAALLDLTSSNSAPDKAEEKLDGDNGKSGKLPTRGVWQNGGGHKLVGNLGRRDHLK